NLGCRQRECRMDEIEFSEDDLRLDRTCVNCGNKYSIALTPSHCFAPPYNFSRGCVTRCLACWLGCGPEHYDLEGDLLREIGSALGPETHLVLMPIARIIVQAPY